MSCRYSPCGPLLVAAVVLICVCGCTKPTTTEPNPMQAARLQEDQRQTSPSIQMILEHPMDYSGASVTLEGVFKGWRGKCKNGPPVSRSDWMIQDASGCIYIYGPLPNGLQASDPNDEPVTVSGILRVNQQGIPYLELVP